MPIVQAYGWEGVKLKIIQWWEYNKWLHFSSLNLWWADLYRDLLIFAWLGLLQESFFWKVLGADIAPFFAALPVKSLWFQRGERLRKIYTSMCVATSSVCTCAAKEATTRRICIKSCIHLIRWKTRREPSPRWLSSCKCAYLARRHIHYTDKSPPCTAAWD